VKKERERERWKEREGEGNSGFAAFFSYSLCSRCVECSTVLLEEEGERVKGLRSYAVNWVRRGETEGGKNGALCTSLSFSIPFASLISKETICDRHRERYGEKTGQKWRRR
jgi:hypothetical protein